MPLFPSDFKKFKHVANDDKTVTLEHPAGHQIIIAKSAIKGPMRDQLEALCNGGEVKKMQEGGLVEEAKRRNLLGGQRMVDQKIADEKRGQARERYINDPTKDGRTPEQKAKAKSYDDNQVLEGYYYAKGGITPGYAKGGIIPKKDGRQMLAEGTEDQVLQADPNAPQFVNDITRIDKPEGEAPPDLTRTKEIYNQLGQYGKTGDPSMPSNFEPFEVGKTPSTLDSNTWQQSRKMESEEKAANAAQAAADQQKIIQENLARTDAGLPPLEVPNVPTGPQMPESDVAPAPGLETSAAAATTQSQAGQPTLQQAYANEMAGSKAISDEQAKLGADNAKILQDAQNTSMELQQQYKQDYDNLNQERQHLMADVQNGQVDPEKFWDNHSKLASAIGIIIAGFNPTNNPNAAINFLDKQMEANLKSQQMNLDSKKSLLSANLQQFGNMNTAMNMTRVMQADLVTNQLQTAAAKASSPLAKAAALKAAGEIQAKYAPLFATVAKQATLSKATQAANQDPSKIPGLIAALDASGDHETAKDMRSRLIPLPGGKGMLANTADDAKYLKEVEDRRLNINKNAGDILKIVKDKGTFELTGSTEADIENKLNQIATDMAKMTDPASTARESEVVLVRKALMGTGMGTANQTAKKQLENFYKTVEDRAANSYKIRGLTPPNAPGLNEGDIVTGKDGKQYKQGTTASGKKYYLPIQAGK